MQRLLSYLLAELKSWQKRSPQLAVTVYAVLSLHLFLILFFLTERELSPPKKETIIIHTVSLQPKKQPVATAPIAAMTPTELPAPVEILEITPPPPKATEPPPPKEKAKPKKEAPPKPKEDKKPPTPKPKKENKPSEPLKPKKEKPKKEEPATVKESPKKETPKKETATTKEPAPQKKPSETAQKQKERSAEQDKLLAEALASLDQAASSKKTTTVTPSKAVAAPLLAPPGTLGGENLEAAQREYKDELARHLKLLLKLPEYGPVKIELLVRREGTVAQVKILSGESTLNRQYVESNLPKHRLPPFGLSFPGEKEQTFVLTLTNTK